MAPVEPRSLSASCLILSCDGAELKTFSQKKKATAASSQEKWQEKEAETSDSPSRTFTHHPPTTTQLLRCLQVVISLVISLILSLARSGCADRSGSLWLYVHFV